MKLLVFILCASTVTQGGVLETRSEVAGRSRKPTSYLGNNLNEGKCTAVTANAVKGYSQLKKTKQCVFPFVYKGIEYDRCTGFEWTALWCSTETTGNGEYIDGEWGNCDLNTCKEGKPAPAN